jgi:hypothetical protein
MQMNRITLNLCASFELNSRIGKKKRKKENSLDLYESALESVLHDESGLAMFEASIVCRDFRCSLFFFGLLREGFRMSNAAIFFIRAKE